MSQIAISSFSLNQKLGPLRLVFRDAEGVKQPFEMPMPQEITLEQFASKVAEDFGVTAIEICQIQLEDDDERIGRLRTELAALNVRVLTMPIDVGSLAVATGDHLEEDVADIEHWLDIAQSFGAVYARVNVGVPHGYEGQEQRESLVASLRRLAAAAAERGLKLLVENHGGSSSDPDYLLALREEVGVNQLGILLDIGNFSPVQDVSVAKLSGKEVDDLAIDAEIVYDHIARLAPHAELVHAKAYDPRSDGTPLLDVDRALKIVADAGYTGSVSVEWEGQKIDPWTGTSATLDAVRRAFPALTAGNAA